MDHSETIGAVSKALVAACGEVGNAVKDSTNPHFKSKYASLNSVLDTIKPVFAKHGLAIVQFPAAGGDDAALLSVVLHESGEYLSMLAGCPIQKQDPQGVGSAYTYLRRYSLAAIAGIAQEDDDGNASSYGPDHTANRGGKSPGLRCPECGSALYDNRYDKEIGKRSDKFPDLKCSSNGCGWTQWLDSWAEFLLAEAEAAFKAEAIDERAHARAQVVVEDRDVPNMLKVQKHLTDLARH